ncbi:class I SAM-dependent DNA methyltransferase [Umezawaea endophytica]|uniref:Methyltransferase domain-containing protein n=1 Tax=Umezawaea endophytica TaxID=1654476 RepID=A0A9X2VMT5_9PSEU|nr:class I SAM-dependent methyltransferase [Umezawaea endophytica]MCS7479598.1 methyltransferase domain-containing protein [Umezawaea endophytica]
MTEPAFLNDTRTSYDTIAADYADVVDDLLARTPLDRAMLGAFAEHVTGGPVGDIGCGPGLVTHHLRGLGLDAFGVDLSPGMVEVARRRYPDLRFEVGSMLELDLPDGGLGGLVAWYSIIHVPTDRLPEVFAEFRRVLAPGGHVLLAFQVGDEALHVTRGYGHDVDLTAYRLPPATIEELLEKAGFTMTARMVREPGEREKVPQAYLLARTPS